MLGRAQALLEALGCHAVILYGSRAHGDDHADSDWDIAGIRSGGDVVHIVDGALDLFAYPEIHFATLREDDLKLEGGTIVLDRDSFALGLLARLADLERAGPPPMSATEAGEIRGWYPKTLRRIARGDAEADYRRTCLLYDALPDYFHLRGRWYRGPKRSFQWLRENEPAAHEVFARALAPGRGRRSSRRWWRACSRPRRRRRRRKRSVAYAYAYVQNRSVAEIPAPCGVTAGATISASECRQNK